MIETIGTSVAYLLAFLLFLALFVAAPVWALMYAVSSLSVSQALVLWLLAVALVKS